MPCCRPAPPVAQQQEQALGQHGVAVAPAFTALDPQQHPLAVDIADLQRRHLGDAQARAIGDRQRGLMLEGTRRIEQPLHLGHGQHDRDLAYLPRADELAREVGAVERVGEEEPQRADDAVHGRRRDARLLLIDLELPDILGARSVGRASEPGREPSDVAQIITLRLLREAAHGHVVDQPLAQRADRANLDKLVHRSTPQVKEPKGSACGSPRSIRRGDHWAALHRG
jgi:hypothetical protein